MTKIIVIGTSHSYQVRDRKADMNALGQFKQLLFSLCSQYTVNAIGEEMNEEALEESGAVGSVAHAVAIHLNLQHQFSDPPLRVRQELGIRQENNIRAFGFIENKTEAQMQAEINNSHAIREQYWLDRLKSLKLSPLLFICGADHSETFSALVRNSGIAVIIPFSDWKASS